MPLNNIIIQFSKKCNGLLLPISFTAIILLMIFTSFLISSKIKSSTHHMVTTIKAQNEANALLGTMSQSAFNRTILLREMLESDDPFKNDDLFSELNLKGTEFANARTILKQQSKSERLQELLTQQGQIAQFNAPLQNEIYDLIFNNEREQANILFVSSALPTMKRHINSINELVKQQFSNTKELVKKSESEVSSTLSSVQNLNIASIFISIILAVFVLYKKKEGERKLSFLAHTDTLTKLPNRLSLIRIIDSYILSKPKHPFAIVFFDIDYFKNINDTYGHEIGDEILIRFAATITSMIKPGDVISRFGGDVI